MTPSTSTDYVAQLTYLCNGAQFTDTVSVTTGAGLNVTTSGTDASCNGVADGTASVTASGTGAPFTYSWSNGDSVTNLSGLAAGTYYITVSDVGGCSVTDSVIIAEPTAVVPVIANQVDVMCVGAATGILTATASGGSPGYTYALDAGPSTNESTFGGLTAGPYTITATDLNGCMGSVNATIVETLSLIHISEPTRLV